MYPKKHIFSAFVITAFLCMAVASMVAASELSISEQASLTISYYDKKVYVPGSEIFVKVSILNKGSIPLRFRLADDKRRSLSFEVKTLSNRKLEPSEMLKRALASSSPAYYREMVLLPGEEYSFVDDIAGYVKLDEPGAYVVSCIFYPELLESHVKTESIKSNSLSLSLRPGPMTPLVAEFFRAESFEVLKAERISPDEVVARTIKARQKGNWNEFFLYLDVERLFKANPDRARAYNRESDDGRRRMISAYKAELMLSRVDTDIVVIPSSFEIKETRYGPSYGKVTTLQKFAYDGFSLLKEYIYELERRDDIWYIVEYTVINKGSE